MSWLRKLSSTYTHPLIFICEFPLLSIYEFLKPYNLLFFEFESFVNGWIQIGKNWLSNFICHLSFLKKLSPNHTHPPISIPEFSKPYELLFLEFESFVKCKIWIVKKSHSIILSVTCHGLRNFPHSYASPHIHLCIFKTLWVFLVFFLSFQVFCKMLNMNCKKYSLNNFICHLSFLE